MKPPKISTKLTLFYTIVFTLFLAGVSALYYNLLEFQLDKALRDDLEERAAALRGYLNFDEGEPQLEYDASDPEEANFITIATRYYQVYDATTAAMIRRSPAMEALGFQYTSEEVKELVGLVGHSDISSIQTEQVSLLIHSDLVRAPDGRPYLIQIGASLRPRDTALNQLFHISLWLVPAGGLLGILLGWWMAKRVLRPVKALGEVAQEIGISQLHRRLPVRGSGDELDQLAQTFNEVLARLETAVGQMQEFTANISHELRTPLTALRGEAAVALANARSESDYRRVLESQLEEFEKLSRMVNQMLTLARAEAGQIQIAHETVDLSALARSLAEQMEAVAWSKGITLTAELDGKVMVVGDSGWLEHVILNLLDNAIKFTQESGRVRVSVSSREGDAIIEIHDSGIGISPDVLPHVFERFYRGDPSRSKELEGAGLGLSLVEWIVKQHHGKVNVESQTGHGSIFRVALPLAHPVSPESF